MTAQGAGGADTRRRLRERGEALITEAEVRHGGPLAHVRGLPALAGTSTVSANLVGALTALSLLRDVVPAQMQLRDDLVALHESEVAELAEEMRPPDGPAHWIAAYLRAEQRQGRLRADLNCEMTALCLLATLLGLALTPGPPPPDELLEAVIDHHVRILLDGAAVAG